MRLAMLAGLALVLASCAAPSPFSDITDYAETPLEYHVHVAGRAGEISQQDRYFVFLAGVGDLYAIALAELAQSRTQSPAIKAFAQEVLADNQASYRYLALVAPQHVGRPAPTALDRPHAAALEALAAAGDFDRAYLGQQGAADAEAMATLRQETVTGSEPVMVRFAAATLPVLERRAEALRALEATVR